MPAGEREVAHQTHCMIDIMPTTTTANKRCTTASGPTTAATTTTAEAKGKAKTKTRTKTVEQTQLINSSSSSVNLHGPGAGHITLRAGNSPPLQKQQQLCNSENSGAESSTSTNTEEYSENSEDQARPATGSSVIIKTFIHKRISVLCLLLATVIFGMLSAHSYFNAQADTPGCTMSYSRPQFIEQTAFDKSWTRFSTKYKLYLYREGGYDSIDEAFRIPVLFVPGNAGSPKQVRSIASATTAAFVELLGLDPEAVERGQVGYDFFSVGLNEEFTALHGYSIMEQADFINDAIRYILSLYPGTRSKYRLSKKHTFALPTSVIIVGHSMGGVVARTAFTLSNHIVGSVQAIFTLATPHNNPTASLEYYVDKVYTDINRFWRHGFQNGTLDNVSLVSIAGGNLDSMINSDYTYVGDLAPAHNSLSVLASGIEDVWLSLDHQCILWCEQMAKKFAAVMVQIMDARRSSQILPLDERMAVMREMLYSKLDETGELKDIGARRNVTVAGYSHVQVHEEVVQVALAGRKNRDGAALHLMRLPGVAGENSRSAADVLQIIHYARRRSGLSARSSGSSNAMEEFKYGVFGCRHGESNDDPTDGVCEKILGLAVPAKLPLKSAGAKAQLAVPLVGYLEVPMAQLRGFAYVALEIPSGSDGLTGFVRASVGSNTSPVVHSPGYLRLLRAYTINAPERLNARTRIKLDVPENPFFVFRAKLIMHRRNMAAALKLDKPQFGTVVRQSDGRRRFESKFWYDQGALDIAIHGRGAYLPSDDLVNTPSASMQGELGADLWDGVHLDVWADNVFYSGFEISLRINWYSSLNRLVKRYDMALLAMSFVWACLVMLHQLRSWDRGQSGSASDAGQTAVFPGCLASIEALIRNGILLGVVAAAMATPLVQVGFAHIARGTMSPATLAAANNLFMGVRGSGLVLCLLPSVLVILSLGFIIVQAIFLTAVCHSAAWLAVGVAKWWRQRLMQGDRILAGGGGGLGADKVPTITGPLLGTLAFVVFVCTFVPYQFAFLVIYLAQLITVVRTMAQAKLQASCGGGGKDAGRRGVELDSRAQYQLALVLFWTSSLPYCAPELLVWVRNLSVLWFEDAPSDHNLLNMAGYFALRVTFVFFAGAVLVAWLVSVRRPYVLYGVANAVSAWLALIQFAEFPMRILNSKRERESMGVVVANKSPVALVSVPASVCERDSAVMTTMVETDDGAMMPLLERKLR
ncbi:GPI inositol deacylase [Kickxella alabastrina]|uniref:GPI inositol deacylase n=1 Tax=Kickxella alabastrina TaxID=61397 RepID=A0ACC1ITE8_9FUNG|nr:GPI inositol deacylase [Kickxella alabastrina]